MTTEKKTSIDFATLRVERLQKIPQLYLIASFIISAFIYLGHSSFYFEASPLNEIARDDLFLNLRFAKNLLHSLELSANSNLAPNDRIESIQSPVWATWLSLLTIVSEKLGIEVLFLAKASTMMIGALILGYLNFFVHPIIAFLVAMSGAFIHATTSGLEFIFFIFLFWISFFELQKKNYLRAAALYGLCAFFRIEYFFFLFPFLFFAPSSKNSIHGIRKFFYYVLLLMPIVVIEFFRLKYFGSLIPGFLIAKLALPKQQGFAQFINLESIPFLNKMKNEFGFLGLTWMICLFSQAYLFIRYKINILETGVILSFAAFCILLYYGAEPISPNKQAMLTVLAIAGTSIFEHAHYHLNRFTEFLKKYKKIPTLLTSVFSDIFACLIICFVALILIEKSFSNMILSEQVVTEKLDQNLITLFAKKLKESSYLSERTILSRYTGLIGFTSEMLTIDVSGVNDLHLSKIDTIPIWRSDIDYILRQNPEWITLKLNFNPLSFSAEAQQKFKEIIAKQPNQIAFNEATWFEFSGSGKNYFEQTILKTPEFHARYLTSFVSPLFSPSEFFAVFCRRDICDSDVNKSLIEWTPNLGRIKAEFNFPETNRYLQKTIELFPEDIHTALTLASRTDDKMTMRKIGQNIFLPTSLRANAYTQIGLMEYHQNNFNSALISFFEVIKVGGKSQTAYSNVAWAYKGMGNEKEAEKWFNRAKEIH